MWLDTDLRITREACLCPPSLYGDVCQYESQRVSLTLRFQAFSDSRRTLFAVIVSLIDDSDQRVIHSYEQLTFLYVHHCHVKFNLYLLYSTRPKHVSAQHSVHIDVFEKSLLTYRGSLLIPITHSFLPVQRLALTYSARMESAFGIGMIVETLVFADVTVDGREKIAALNIRVHVRPMRYALVSRPAIIPSAFALSTNGVLFAGSGRPHVKGMCV